MRITKDAITFYQTLGFIKLKDKIPTPMFLDINLIKNSQKRDNIRQ